LADFFVRQSGRLIAQLMSISDLSQRLKANDRFLLNDAYLYSDVAEGKDQVSNRKD
jgi:hypothetical protein